MFYLLALPIAALLYHSIYRLMVKYIGREPLWLKIYVLVALIYIVGAPVLFINYLSQKLGLSDPASVYATGIIGLGIFLTIINTLPKKRTEGREWS